MRELDDAALELRVRRTLSERLGSLPLDLTAEALERRRVVRDQARRRHRILLGLGLAAALVLPAGWLAAGAHMPRVTDAVVVTVDTPSATPGPMATPVDPPAATSSPEPWPTARSVPNPGVVSLDSPEAGGAGIGTTVPLRTLASAQLAVPVSFWLDGFGGSDAEATTRGSDFCSPIVSNRSIVLPWLMGCVSDLRILVPSAVRCGTADGQPTAEVLAAAILANPGLGARDLGPVESTNALPPGFLRGVAGGRVIDIPGTARSFDRFAADPDGCLIEAGLPDIEVRGDLAARLLLLDVDGDLVIVRMADGGHDSTSGAAARSRGYGSDPSTEISRYMLEHIHDLSFGAAAARP